MEQAGLISPPPPEIEGAAMRIEYVSILSQAQKLVGVAAADRFLQTVVPIMGVFPELHDKVDIHMVVDNYVEMLGVDPRLVRSTEDAVAITAQRQKAEAAMQEAQQAALIAGAAKDASETKLGTDSALDRVAQGYAGQPNTQLEPAGVAS
jgi:hypothetical protein